MTSHRLIWTLFSNLVEKAVLSAPSDCEKARMSSEITVIVCKDIKKNTVHNFSKLVYEGWVNLKNDDDYQSLLELFTMFDMKMDVTLSAIARVKAELTDINGVSVPPHEDIDMKYEESISSVVKISSSDSEQEGTLEYIEDNDWRGLEITDSCNEILQESNEEIVFLGTASEAADVKDRMIPPSDSHDVPSSLKEESSFEGDECQATREGIDQLAHEDVTESETEEEFKPKSEENGDFFVSPRHLYLLREKSNWKVSFT